MIRTFLAIPVACSDPLKSLLKKLRRFQPGVKIGEESQLHVTLAFLGDTNRALIPELARVVAEVASAEQVQNIQLQGLGAFPSLDRASVVWVGFEEAQAIRRMAEQVATRCEKLGFARDTRPFHPHLTVARVKGPSSRELRQFIEQNLNVDLGTTLISSIDVIRSDLSRTGPAYTTLAVGRLGGNSDFL